MNDKKLLLSFATLVLLLTTLLEISCFMLSAFCAITAVLVAIAAIIAIKATVLAAKVAITRNLYIKEENKKITIAGRIAALVMAFTGITAGALTVFTATNIGIVGIFAIPMLTALYLYNYKGEIAEEKIILENRNNENIAMSEDQSCARIEMREVCCQIITSTLTDVNDNLLYGLGDSIGYCVRNLYNKYSYVEHKREF